MKHFLFAVVVLAAIAGVPAVAPAQTVIVNGQQLYLNPGPIVREGRVFVPLRGIFERLGASVVYSAGTINATKGGTTVSLRIGSTQATVSGQAQTLDVAPFIVGATTYVPLRFVAQSLGAQVGYDAATHVVSVELAGQMVPVRPPPRPNPPPMPQPVRLVDLRNRQPGAGERVTDRFVRISADFTYRVDPGTVRVWLDDNNITSRCNISGSGFAYKPISPLEFGSHGVRVTGRNGDGSQFSRTWSFSVAGSPPTSQPANPIQVRAMQPSPGTGVDDRFVVIKAEFSREVSADSVRVLLDGNNITSRSGVSSTGFSYKPPAPLDFGSHTVRVTGRGPAGGSPFDRSWSFRVNRSGPTMHLTINQPAANAPVNRTFTLAGNTVANGDVSVTAGVTPSVAGQFTGSTTAGPMGNFRLQVTLKALMGQQAVSVRVRVSDPASSQTTEKTLQLRLSP
ncbi:MAG TPA: copper amine oxidase N-terminal domain-containing protein [Candidatus Cybelea sp.]|nr:copper amine oxidase N-terminal domain-containing protein [Candidatus Cybelea sp.]